MTKQSALRAVLLWEAVGFVCLVILIWLNEMADLPANLFKQSSTPVNVVEAALETYAVLVLGLMTMMLTRKVILRLRYVEGFLPVCSFCKKIRLPDDSWIPIEQYIGERSDASFTHSYCPECIEKHYGEYLRKK